MQWKACATYDGKGVGSELIGHVTVDLDAKLEDKRLFYLGAEKMQSTFVSDLTLTKKRQQCTSNVELGVRFSSSTDRVSPIVVASKITVDVPEGELSPIVNPFSNDQDETSMELWRDCGDDNVCQSDLTAKATKSIVPDPTLTEQSLTKLTIDAQNTVLLNSSLTVEKELSYGYVQW